MNLRDNIETHVEIVADHSLRYGNADVRSRTDVILNEVRHAITSDAFIERMLHVARCEELPWLKSLEWPVTYHRALIQSYRTGINAAFDQFTEEEK